MDEKAQQELKELVIAESFNGDADAYQKEIDSQWGRVIRWRDIEAAAKTYPELEKIGHVLIDEILGYVPPLFITLPYEPFLRALFHDPTNRALPDDQFVALFDDYIIPMRNRDLDYHGHLLLPLELFTRYNRVSPELKQRARNRLTGFLGYEPEKAASMTAEFMIQSALMDDMCKMPDRLTDTDLQALTIIKYREVLLDHGLDAANASPLIARDMRAAFGIDHFVTGFRLPDSHR